MGMVIKGTKPDGTRADLQLDADENLKVSTIGSAPDIEDAKFLAGAGSRTGRIGTLAISGVMYVRLDADDANYTRAEWLVQSNKAHAVALYKSREPVDSVTVTLGTADLDDGDTAVVNGKTFTADTDTTNCLAGEYAIDGNTAADVVELKKVLVPGVSITPTSAVAADTVTVNDHVFTGHATTTTAASGAWDIADDATAAAAIASCINHKDNVTLASVAVADVVYVNEKTYTAAASAVVASGVFSQNGTDSQDGDSLVLCINHKDTITLASAVAGDQVIVNDVVFEGKASTAVYQEHRFSIDTGDTEAAASLVLAINHADWGVPGVTAASSLGVVTLTPDTFDQEITVEAGVGGTNEHTRVVCAAANGVRGVTAVNASGVVSLTRDYEAATIALSSSSATTLACVAANGVPGVTAAVSDANECYVVPNWLGLEIVVTSSDDTIKYGNYGLTGCKVASTATTVVITPDMDAAEPCTCIYAVIGTADANEFTVTNGTLASLEKVEGSTRMAIAANSTTRGTLYEQYVDGMPHLYLGFTSEDAAAVSVPVVKATLYK